VYLSIETIGMVHTNKIQTRGGRKDMNYDKRKGAEPPRIRSLTPVLVVESVEPCIRFWIERFGFRTENEVPGPDGKLVFATVEKEGVKVMYQTRASVLAERPDTAADMAGHSMALFLIVEDLDAVERAVAGASVVKPRHETFYGSTEIYVREPGGNVVGFAQMAK
jgi:uncharacterized glyoxalase superfamily protein PhnB